MKSERHLVRFDTLHQRLAPDRSKNAFRVFVWRQMRRGLFPRSVTIGSSTVAWWSDELEEWEKNLPRAGQGPEA